MDGGVNLSIRDANVCHALEGVGEDEALHEAQAIYLRWAPRDWLKAEAAALEWLRVRALAGPVLVEAAAMHERDASGEVLAFMRERLERMHFPNKRAA